MRRISCADVHLHTTEGRMRRLARWAGCIAVIGVGCQMARAPAPPPIKAEQAASLNAEAIAKTSAPLAPMHRTLPESGERPRLLLTRARIERARLAVMGGSKEFRKLESECTQARSSPHPSGYEGWDWGHLVARCAIAWRTTGKAEHAQTAIMYLQALLDDRAMPGDGKGGDAVVRHDHGYPIRTHGFYSALGYDWLHDAPQMTPELRAKIVDRLEAWLDWYGESGYQRNSPVSNYFTGYFLALAYAGLAIHGDDPRGDAMLQRADDLFDEKVAPRYKQLLAGGGWPEGWQYGDGAAFAMALVIDGQKTARKRDRLRDLPWLRDVVRHHAHALLPDGVTAHANGDWGARPTRMPSRALEALAMVLPEDGPAPAEARFLARRLRTEKDDWAWLRLFSDGPTARVIDPRHGKPSYLVAGTGLVYARSDWGRDATFVSLQCGPAIEEADHQHADQGHFDIVRGSDFLLTSVADYGSFASINHNTILVDDRGTSLDYSPNQGAWGRDSRIVRFVDADTYVYAEGDFTDAYRPAKLDYGAKRSVLRAERALTFVRPGVVVIYDRVRVADPTFDVTWAAHSLTAPQVSGANVVVRKGQSVLDLRPLLPKDLRVRVVAEPEKSKKAKSAYQANETWAPAFRIEFGAPRGHEVRFLTVAQTGGAGFTAQRAERIEGPDLDGAIIGDKEGSVAIVFPRAKTTWSGPLKWNMKRPDQIIVVGLEPGRHYRIVAKAIQTGCSLEVESGEGRAADEGGTLLLKMTEGCGVR